LFESELAADEIERVREVMREWIERADALDRKRNHFLKAFRGRHGFDRNAYGPEELAAFEQGLAAVNAEVDRERADSRDGSSPRPRRARAGAPVAE
jgi:hypothetical protein